MAMSYHLRFTKQVVGTERVVGDAIRSISALRRRNEKRIGQKDRTQKNEGAYLSAFDFSAIQLGSLQVGGTNCIKIEEVNRSSPGKCLVLFAPR